MKDVEALKTILESEAELATGIYDQVTREMEAIIRISASGVAATVRAETELMKPLEILDRERARCADEIGKRLFPDGTQHPRSMTVRELVRYLPPAEAVAVSGAADRLRSVVENIVAANGRNRVLLERSRRFVEETLRIVTDDHTRTLIDQRM
jgi:flagellar biosynthesis/type III secretory pathway chaperone